MIIPNTPYVLQHSQGYPGMTVECLLFLDYRWLSSLYNQLIKHSRDNPEIKKSGLHQHLDFVFTAENRLVPKILCPICQKETAIFFVFIGDSLINKKFICCNQLACRRDYSEAYHWAGFHPLRPLMLIKPDFQKVSNQKKLITLLKSVYGLSKQLDPLEILRLLQTTF